MDLSNLRKRMLLYWLGTPYQHRQTNRLYRQIRTGAAARELARMNGERGTSPGYDQVMTHCVWSDRFKNRVLPDGAHLWYKAQDALWWLGKSPNVRLLPTSPSCASSITRPRSSNILPPWTPSADRGALQLRSSFRHGLLRKVDESSGVETATT